MRTTICWHKPLLHKLTQSPLHSDEGFFTGTEQKHKPHLSTFFRTLSFFQKIFVNLKLQTNKDVTLSKHHRLSTLALPLAVPKTYSSFQDLFSEAKS